MAAANEEYSKPILKNGRFDNPWETWRKPSFLTFFKCLMTTRNQSNVPSEEILNSTLPIVKPNISEFNVSPSSGVRMMWIGHATVVAQLDGFTVITDPVFSNRCSFTQSFGVARYRKPPCTIEELPKIDAVIISHNHYDHLDYTSVVDLNQRFGKNLRWFVPLGLKEWMVAVGCANVVEMSWWDEIQIKDFPGLRIACTPSQHWCRRSLNDYNKVLWCSWCILGPHHSFHFSGDTGYCKGFKEIGCKYGPFTAAAIPIGAYHPRWFMNPQHVDPAQAVAIHQDIGSQSSLGIHWGTFVLTYENYLEPPELLKKEMEKQKVTSSFITISHGAVHVFGSTS